MTTVANAGVIGVFMLILSLATALLSKGGLNWEEIIPAGVVGLNSFLIFLIGSGINKPKKNNIP